MKKLTIYIWMAMLVGLAIILGGCEGNTYLKPKTEELDISDALLVEFITEALDASAMGMNYDVHTAVVVANRYLGNSDMASFCGVQIDSTISYTYDEAHSMGYEGQCNWTVHCNNTSIPQSLDFYNHLTCMYQSTVIPRLSSTTGMGDWTLATDSETNQLLLSGDYIRDGYYKLDANWDNSYYYKITFNASSLDVDAVTLQLVEGIIPFGGYIKDVTITGLGPMREFEGQLEVMPNGKLKVVMSGVEYVF